MAWGKTSIVSTILCILYIVYIYIQNLTFKIGNVFLSHHQRPSPLSAPLIPLHVTFFITKTSILLCNDNEKTLLSPVLRVYVMLSNHFHGKMMGWLIHSVTVQANTVLDVIMQSDFKRLLYHY